MITNMFTRKSREHNFRVRCHDWYLSLDFTWSVSIIVFVCAREDLTIYVFDRSLASWNCKCMCQKDCLYFWPQIEKLLKTMEIFFVIKFANSYKNEYKWINIASFRIDFSIIRQRLVIIHCDENKYFNWQLNFISLYSVDDGFTTKNFSNGLFMQNSVCEFRTKFRYLDSEIMQYVYKCSQVQLKVFRLVARKTI